MDATAAACNLLLTKHQLPRRSLGGTSCNISLSTSSGREERQTMLHVQFFTIDQDRSVKRVHYRAVRCKLSH